MSIEVEVYDSLCQKGNFRWTSLKIGSFRRSSGPKKPEIRRETVVNLEGKDPHFFKFGYVASTGNAGTPTPPPSSGEMGFAWQTTVEIDNGRKMNCWGNLSAGNRNQLGLTFCDLLSGDRIITRTGNIKLTIGPATEAARVTINCTGRFDLERSNPKKTTLEISLMEKAALKGGAIITIK